METVRELIRIAKEAQTAGDVAKAMATYEEILELDPKHAASLHAFGILLNQREDFGRAAILLEQAVTLRPSDPAFHVELAESCRNLGRYRDAVGSCLVGLRLRPGFPEAYNTLGLALRGVGDHQGALDQFHQAVLHNPTFFPAHVNAGLLLQELGQLDAAIPHFLRAVEISPASFPCRTNLGLALMARGMAADALAHLEEAARLSPDEASAHQNLGDALRLLGRNEEARASYLKAIRLEPGLTLCYLHVGMTLRLEGSFGDALKWCKLAVEMEPDNPKLWEELADLHNKRDEPDEAVKCWQRIIELSPPDPIGVRISLGWALQEDGRHDEALEQYRSCLELQPDAARVHFALGGVHEELGDMAEAEAAVRQAIRLQPRFPAAYARLATLLRAKLPDDDLEVLEALLSEPGLGPQPRARLLFAVAHVLDGRREYSRAASCLREANASTLELRRAEGVIYKPDDHEQFVERLTQAFDHDFFRRTAGLGLETRRPVFIVGLPRSGTTLVEQVLASHPRVHGAGERLFGRRSFEKLPSVTGLERSPVECVASLEEYAIKRLAGEHLGKLNELDLGRARRIVDKLPDNYMYIGLLVTLFPKAVFIHCRRDLRDIAVSCWMSDFRGVRWANDPTHIGSRFRRYRQLMEHWKRDFPAPIIEVHYEDTVSDLEGVARRLIEGCGLDWDAACLDFHRTQRVVRTASLTQVRQPIYKSSVARWKNYEDDLTELFAVITDGNPDNE